MAKKPFLKLRRLYEDQGLLQKELSELSGIPMDYIFIPDESIST